MSSGSPKRPSGTRDSKSLITCFILAPFIMLDTPSVLMPPGAMTLARIFFGAISNAKFFVKPHTPCFEAS